MKMKNRLKPSMPYTHLRMRAEKQLAERLATRRCAGSEPGPSEVDASRVLHELQVHGVELELQNEELQLARSELELTLAKYHDLFHSAPVGYITVDRRGIITEANLSAALLLRRDEKLLSGRRLCTFVSSASRFACQAFLDKLRQGASKEECEVVIESIGSNPSHVHLEGVAAGSAENVEVRVVLMDVTAHRQAEAALRTACEDLARQAVSRSEALARARVGLETSEGRLARAQRVGKVGIWEYEPVSQYVYWSDEMYELFDMDRTESASSLETLASILHPGDAFLLSPEVLRDYLSRPQIDVRCRILTQEKRSLRHLHVSGSATRDGEGEVVMLSGTVRDVTEQTLSEEKQCLVDRRLLESQKIESVGLMTGGVVHDFNNLLQSILGNAELALLDADGYPDSPVMERLDEIKATALRSSELARRLLAYLGQERPSFGPVSLNEVVAETARLLAVSLSKKAVVKHRLADNLPAVEGDTTQLGQVVMNLVINAVEALGGEVGSVRVRTGLSEWDHRGQPDFAWSHWLPEGQYVCLEVEDSGCGMDVETQRRILEPFFSTKAEGRGLGLSAVLAIVNKHGGAVGFSSKPGLGTTFRVLLPESTQVADSQAPRSHIRELWRGSGLVLVVDDEPEVQSIARAMLMRVGFDVVLAPHGRAAVDIMTKRGCEMRLVLLDLDMPVMDGLQAMAEIRRIRPDVPAILSSGYANEDVVLRYEQLGFAGFLQKPYALGALIEVVRGALQGPALAARRQAM